MTRTDPTRNNALNRLRWPLRLTRWGMIAERVTIAFWPAWSLLLLVLAALMLGLHDSLPLEAVWSVSVLALLGLVAALGLGIRRFRWPGRAEALDRLDRTLPGRPITALGDEQAIGAGDAASRQVWKAHLDRMAARVAGARPVPPDLRIAARDPYALRYVALLAFAIALLFGSVLRVSSVAQMTPGGGKAIATGPSWEGWIEPPAYTGKPSLYLNDIEQARFAVPEASRLTLRLYGEVGSLTVGETVSGRIGELPPATDSTQSFTIAQSGKLEIEGPGGRDWQIDVIADEPPSVRVMGAAERGVTGEMRQPFKATDDYGVVAGQAELSLALDAVDRRYGLAVAPEPRDPVVLDLPMTITGDRSDFTETLIENLSQHPWATLPVSLQLDVEDALAQHGLSEPETITLPGRRFFNPLAGAIVEQRRDLLWSRENATRVSQVLRAISYRPDDIFRSETAYLKLRFALRRLEVFAEYGLSADQRDEIAQVLWDIAVLIEDGNLADARERLREAREKLAEAIRNGATDEEIAELMQELREAMQDYMQQLAQQQRENGQEQAENRNTQEITGDQLKQLMDRLQQLMEEGRTEEAEALLDRLAEMMENMQVTEGEGGENSAGQQAMDGLADTLRDQQGLSDETFGDLQEQFNGNAPPQDGPPQDGTRQGRQPGQQGETGELPGQSGEQGDGSEQGEGQGQGQNGRSTPGAGERAGESERSLAERQRALRRELDRQRGNLPGAGTPEGDAARDALGRAGEAMDDAEDALRNDDLAGALDNQAEAIEALRDGMRNLGEALAQQQQQGQQGEAQGRADRTEGRDPLGREPGATGRIGTDENLLQGDDVYRRARELLDEIRRRSSDKTRPDRELNYLERLLDRF